MTNVKRCTLRNSHVTLLHAQAGDALVKPALKTHAIKMCLQQIAQPQNAICGPAVVALTNALPGVALDRTAIFDRLAKAKNAQPFLHLQDMDPYSCSASLLNALDLTAKRSFA